MGRSDQQRKGDIPYGWVIAISNSFLFAIVCGVQKSRGIILVELIELFPHVPVSAFLWIFSISKLTSKSLGPVFGMMIAKTTHRTLAISGVLLMTTSLFVFGYLPRYEYMFPVFGVGVGAACGMLTFCVYTSSAPYFTKRKSLATGISTSGSGLGLLIIIPILRVLFDNYSFSGAFVMFAGISMQTLVLAALLRPISYYTGDSNATLQLQETDLHTAISTQNLADINADLNADRNLVSAKKSASFLSLNENEGHSLSTQPSKTGEVIPDNNQQDPSFLTTGEAALPDRSKEAPKPASFNWRLVYSPYSLAAGMSFLCKSSGLIATFQCLPPLAQSKGVSKEIVALLFSIGGGLDIPSRVFIGWLTDKRFIPVSGMLAISSMVMMISALMCTLLPGIAGVAMMAICTSVAGTATFAILPGLLEDLMGKENLTSALSLNFVYEGFSGIFCTVVVGAIYESTKNWQSVFYFISSCFLAEFTIMILITVILIRKKRREAAL